MELDEDDETHSPSSWQESLSLRVQDVASRALHAEAHARKLQAVVVTGDIEGAGNAIDRSVWSLFAVPGSLTMVLFFVGLGLGTMAIMKSDPSGAGGAAVVLGVVAFFCVIAAISHAAFGAALRAGGEFLSTAIGKAANNGATLECSGTPDVQQVVLCDCMETLIDIIKGLGTASLVVATSYVFSAIVSISASSGLTSSKKEMGATKLVDANQVQIQTVGAGM